MQFALTRMPGTTTVERGGNPRGKKIPRIPISPFSSIALASLQQRHFFPFSFSISSPGGCKLSVSSLVFHTLLFLALFQISRVSLFFFFFLLLAALSSSPSPLRFLHLHSSWLMDSWPSTSSEADLSHVPVGSLSPCPCFLPSGNEWNIPFLLQVTNSQMYQHSLQIHKIPCPSQPEQSCPSTLSELNTYWLGKRTSHFT